MSRTLNRIFCIFIVAANFMAVLSIKQPDKHFNWLMPGEKTKTLVELPKQEAIINEENNEGED